MSFVISAAYAFSLSISWRRPGYRRHARQSRTPAGAERLDTSAGGRPCRSWPTGSLSPATNSTGHVPDPFCRRWLVICWLKRDAAAASGEKQPHRRVRAAHGDRRCSRSTLPSSADSQSTSVRFGAEQPCCSRRRPAPSPGRSSRSAPATAGHERWPACQPCRRWPARGCQPVPMMTAARHRAGIADEIRPRQERPHAVPHDAQRRVRKALLQPLVQRDGCRPPPCCQPSCPDRNTPAFRPPAATSRGPGGRARPPRCPGQSESAREAVVPRDVLGHAVRRSAVHAADGHALRHPQHPVQPRLARPLDRNVNSSIFIMEKPSSLCYNVVENIDIIAYFYAEGKRRL